MEGMELPEEKVLEKLNAVSTAKRLANMVRVMYRAGTWGGGLIAVSMQELHDSEFGKREEVHRTKKAQHGAVARASVPGDVLL